jgi:NAD(P)-dependent dehydrogenase (short-subunit alcohol dehydrogenase family)
LRTILFLNTIGCDLNIYIEEERLMENIMEGKTCMITGANVGIGKQTALNLAKMGARVVMVCRDPEKGENAMAEIQSRSENSQIELMLANLSSMAAIRVLAKEFKNTHEKLDVLINNAGVVPWKRSLTVDGMELTFAVNHLAPFLLTNLLLDTIKASTPARIINLTSGLHTGASIDFDDLQSEKKFGGFHSYKEAKLANVLFTFELARRLEGTGVTVNTVHPGVIKTALGRHSPWYLRIGTVFFKDPEVGAETPTYLASSPEVETVTGKYFKNKEQIQSCDEAYDEAIAKRLWDVSTELTGLA